MRRPDRRYLIIKRLLDFTAVLTAAIVLVPLGGVIALAIRLDSSGPVVYSQMRTGQYGRRFKIYKFRTMVENADELKKEMAHLNILEPPDFKIPDDPRITRVGRILRKTSLDELPQLINVFTGQMSLVGPRPTSFEASTYDLWHARRLEVPPGLTGLWQLGDRHISGFDDRVRIDDEYMRTMSLATDLKILVGTVGTVVRGEGV